MKHKSYLELWVTCPREWEEIWNAFCFEAGASGLETLEEFPESLKMRVFFEEHSRATLESLPTQFYAEYTEGQPVLETFEVQEHLYQNWQTAWREHFTPQEVGRSFIICPPWELPQITGKRQLLIIEPGQGFGTGTHPSTQLALEALEEYLLNRSELPHKLLDVGIGSGILALAACQLGVLQAEGVDLEAEAIAEVPQNAEHNHLRHRVQAWVGTPAPLQEPYPLVISNMLWHELLSVADDFERLVSNGGGLIVSGLLAEQVPEMQAALKPRGFELSSSLAKEEWRALIFQKIK